MTKSDAHLYIEADDTIFEYVGTDLKTGKKTIVSSLMPNLVGKTIMTIDGKDVEIHDVHLNK